VLDEFHANLLNLWDQSWLIEVSVMLSSSGILLKAMY